MGKLADLVRQFSGCRALVIGDAMLDSYLNGVATKLCTEGPVPVITKTFEEHSPGGAANMASNLSAMGANVTFAGITGADAAGALLRETLREKGVDDNRLIEDHRTATLHKTRILAENQYVLRLDEGNSSSCSPDAQRQLLRYIEAEFPRCDLVVVSDYGYGAASDEVIARLRDLRASNPRVLLVDAKDVRRYRQAGATMLTPNDSEARQAVGEGTSAGEGIGLPDVERVGRKLMRRMDAENLAITLASDGVLLLDRHGNVNHVPAHPVPHARDVGAGDSFSAAVALALGAGAEPLDAVRIGMEAAEIAVRKRWTAVVTAQELLRRIRFGEQSTECVMDDLISMLQADRSSGRSIVLTSGEFDLLHAGHVRFLQRARQFGDVLVVGVRGDASACGLEGQGRLVNSEQDRLALVDALEVVDHAVVFDEDTPEGLIKALEPDVYVVGEECMSIVPPSLQSVCESEGCSLVTVAPMDNTSTDRVLDRLYRSGNGALAEVGT